MNRKLVAIVTGMQHSGTTYLNNVINSHPRIMSGFECGILLGDLKNFEQVKPFSDWLKTGKTHFGLPDDYLEKIKNMNYVQVYDYIQKNKGSKNDCFYQTLIKKCANFTDKTPAYIYQLENIHNKIKHLKVPIIVVLKKYDEVYYSWVIKRGLSHEMFINNLVLCIESLKFISKNPNSDIYVIEYNDLITKKKLYNKHLMNIISTYNKIIPKENLHKPKYDHKIKNDIKYVPDKKSKTINVDTKNHQYKELYNHLLDLIKIKLT